MLSPAFDSIQQASADFGFPRKLCLARDSVSVRVVLAAVFPPRIRAAAHQDHTPSLNGQHAAFSALLPGFSGKRGPGIGQVKSKTAIQHDLATGQGPSQSLNTGQAEKSSEGTGTCQYETSFWGLPFARALPVVAITSANRRLAAEPSARARRLLSAAALHRVRRSARRAILPIASLTPENAAASNSPTSHHPLTSDGRVQPRGATIGVGDPSHAHRAAPADAALRVFLKTQKDIPCSRKS